MINKTLKFITLSLVTFINTVAFCQQQNNTNIQTYLKNQNDVTVEDFLILNFGKDFDSESAKYRHCQGLTSDGQYLYAAIITKNTIQKDHQVKILKINIKSKKIELSKDMGKLGHCNSLTYNQQNNKIYTSPTFDLNAYLFEFDTNLENLKKINLKNEDGSLIKKQYNKSVMFNPNEQNFIVKLSHDSLGYFDENFYFKKRFHTDQLRLNDKVFSQALSTDNQYLYSICNDLTVSPSLNYILVFDMKGKFQRTYTFNTGFGMPNEKPELEQITFVGNDCYGLTKARSRFIISKINIKQKND